MIKKVLFGVVLLGTVWALAASIEPLKLPKSEFSPALGEKIAIPFRTSKAGEVRIEIYTSDWSLIRTISMKVPKGGTYRVVWDGKDSDGDVVPDEAYVLRYILQTDGRRVEYDARKTGGEILQDIDRKADIYGTISYTLPVPARTLVRVGIDGGPMLRILSNWRPRSAGKVRHKWNFKNDSGNVDFSRFRYIAAITAFALPKYSIITTNNTKEDYLTYFKRKQLSCNLPKQITSKMLMRDGKRISVHYFKCRSDERTPKLMLKILKAPKKNGIYILKNDKPVTVVLQMDKEDLALVQKKQYEVSFYVDGRFVSEAEQGYIPIRWIYEPNGLKKGSHIMTVNVTTFDGNVATKSINFVVK